DMTSNSGGPHFGISHSIAINFAETLAGLNVISGYLHVVDIAGVSYSDSWCEDGCNGIRVWIGKRIQGWD
ncbi:hypothetical protein H257_19491, partial [Aphanomyces astaci]